MTFNFDKIKKYIDIKADYIDLKQLIHKYCTGAEFKKVKKSYEKTTIKTRQELQWKNTQVQPFIANYISLITPYKKSQEFTKLITKFLESLSRFQDLTNEFRYNNLFQGFEPTHPVVQEKMVNVVLLFTLVPKIYNTAIYLGIKLKDPIYAQNSARFLEFLKGYCDLLKKSKTTDIKLFEEAE